MTQTSPAQLIMFYEPETHCVNFTLRVGGYDTALIVTAEFIEYNYKDRQLIKRVLNGLANSHFDENAGIYLDLIFPAVNFSEYKYGYYILEKDGISYIPQLNVKMTKPTGSKPAEVDQLPGLSTRVKMPVSGYTGLTFPLSKAIIILNDTHRWTREQIADWLETLDVDLRFGVNDEQDRREGSSSF